ncbi:MAG: hypothetical protein V7K60_32660 [Nostoc sp.]
MKVRDITTREDWLSAYEYEVAVIYLANHRGAKEAEGSEKLY